MIQVPADLLPKLIEVAGQPAAMLALLYGYDRFIAKKRNGAPTKEILHHLDVEMTQHFDQLRRDLGTMIDKATENSMMKYFWEMERGGRRKGDLP